VVCWRGEVGEEGSYIGVGYVLVDGLKMEFGGQNRVGEGYVNR
jgi:hypothetical protein